jgi:chemotaxis methyl-accepting protein methylase
MEFIYSPSTSASYTGRGLVGYSLGPLKQNNLAIDYIEVQKGHDTFMISDKITRTYYVLSGSGYFTIADRNYPVSAGVLIEVPTKVEYCYSGKMKLLLFQSGRWSPDNDTHTKWNPDVVKGYFPRPSTAKFSLIRLVRLRIFGKSPVNLYLRLNQRVWRRLPESITALTTVRQYGDFLHTLARIQGVRAQALATHFLRNRPQLELIRRIVGKSPKVDEIKVAVLGCSTGAEAYSVAWSIRSARPELRLVLNAVDISKQAVEVGKSGVYPRIDSQLTNTNVLERMTEAEIDEFFDSAGDAVTVKSWLQDGITWNAADAGDPEIVGALGTQDIVVANNFLCHMDPPMAEICLRNIAHLVRPQGYLFVSGVDLDVRTKVAKDLGWRPIEELLEEIHEGDPAMRTFWPGQYGGLEPLNKGKKDWRLRYASAFQL